MPPNAGDRVTPPPRPGSWELRFADSAVGGDWEKLVQNVPSAALACFDALSSSPHVYSSRHKHLRGEFAMRAVGGRPLPQWQYDVTSGGRVWYCPDEDRHMVWLTEVHLGAPKKTHRSKGAR